MSAIEWEDVALEAVSGQTVSGEVTLQALVSLRDCVRIVVSSAEMRQAEESYQRKLDLAHARKLGKYLLSHVIRNVRSSFARGDKTEEAGFCDSFLEEVGEQDQYAVAGIVLATKYGKETYQPEAISPSFDRLTVREEGRFLVLDGQHRLKGVELAIDFLRKCLGKRKNLPRNLGTDIPRWDNTDISRRVWKQALAEMARVKLSVQILTDCDLEGMRQVFHDLNCYSKRVDKATALEFDSAKELVRQSKERSSEHSLSEVVHVNALLVKRAFSVKSALDAVIRDEEKDLIKGFWDEVKGKKLVSVILRSLALAAYDYRRHSDEDVLKFIRKAVASLPAKLSDKVYMANDKPIFSDEEGKLNQRTTSVIRPFAVYLLQTVGGVSPAGEKEKVSEKKVSAKSANTTKTKLKKGHRKGAKKAEEPWVEAYAE